MRARQIGRLLLALGMLLLCIWGLRIALIANSLQGNLSRALTFAEAPEEASLGDACNLVADLRGDVVAVRQEAGILIWLAPVLNWLPRVGGDLQAAPHLLVTLDGLTEGGEIVCASLAPVLETFGKMDDFSFGQAVELLAQNQSNLERAVAATDRAQTAWARVDVQRLSPSLARRAKWLERGVPLVRAGAVALSAAADLMGANGTRTYLVLAQNEDELRPTGGFITGVGEVELLDGRLVGMTFRDSYAVDDFSQPYPEPPEPLRRYMQIDQWVFRDSNWSPDFPTAARQALALYRPGHSVVVDGVIALDQLALQELIGALGPLTVPGRGTPITGGNVIPYIRGVWEPVGGALTGEWWKQRKSFMQPLAEAAWGRIKSGEFNPIALGRATLRLLEQKHLLVYLREARVAGLLAERGWDGALQTPDGDMLMVVDANIGYNKVNPRMRESLMYQVDLQSSIPQATLTLTFTHTSKVNYPCKPEARYDPVYEQTMDRCYFDYIRLYAPQGSRLLDATQIPVSGQMLFSGRSEPGNVTTQLAEEGPWIVFGVMGVQPTATTQTRTFSWTLPTDVVKWEGANGWYSVYVQKQPGTVGHPLTVRVRLPQNSVLVEVMPEQVAWDGEWLVYQTTLERDQKVRVHFRR